MSNTIRGGRSIDLNVQAGESLKVSTLTGTYTATVLAGAGAGTALATESSGGATYGPYAAGVVIRVKCSADGLADIDVGVSPALNYAEPARFGYGLDGDVSSLVSGDGNAFAVAQSAALLAGSSASVATANAAAIQAACDRTPGSRLVIPGNLGTIETNTTIYHANIIEVGAGTTLKLRDGSTVSMFRNTNWNPTRTAVVGMTAVARVGAIDTTGMSAAVKALFVVGGHVSILGFTNTGYNGVHPITAVGANSITVRLPSTPAALTATGSGTISIVDDLVGIVGPGAIDYNEAGQAADGTMNTIQVVYANAVRVVVGQGIRVLNAKKFNFLVAGYRFADFQDIYCDTASDMVHFLGPGTDTRCRNITGNTGDDVLAFTIGDVAWFNISRGDFWNIEVDGVNADSLQAMIRISGNSGWKFYRAKIANVFGSSVASPITIADFSADLQGLDFDHIEVCGVNVETATAVPVVAVSTLIAGGGDRLDVDVTQLPSNGAALSVNAANTTVRSVRLRVANPIDGCTAGALLVSNALVSTAVVHGLRAAYGSSVFAIWINAGNVQELMVNDCELGGSGSRLVAQQGTMGRLMMNNIRHTSGYRTFEQSAAANANSVLMASNLRSHSLTNVFYFEKTALLLTSNVTIPSGGVTTSFISHVSGATVTWKGDVDLNGVTEGSGTGTLTKASSVVA